MSPRLHVTKLHVDVTSGCQLKCVGCPNSTGDQKIKYMTVGDFSLVLSNLNITRTHLFRLFVFGEPLLNANLPEMISYIPKQKWTSEIVEISTNAQCFNKSQIVDIIKQKIIKHFVVSCDGDGTPEEFERLRYPGKWDKLMEFLFKVKEIKDQYDPSLKLFTRTICVDEKQQQKWVSLLKPMGWDSQFRGWMPMPHSILTKDNEKAKDGLCYWMKRLSDIIYVDYDGTLMPCCMFPRPFVLGNLINQKFRSTLPKKEEYQEIMKNNKSSLNICNKCLA